MNLHSENPSYQKDLDEQPRGKRRARLSTQDWINIALVEIENVGVKGLRVNTLCEKCGITKGSFYSHFKDKDDLLARVIEYWSVEQPEILKAKIESYEGTGLEKLDQLAKIIEKRQVVRRDLAIREWARFDKTCAAAVKKADLASIELISKYLTQANPEMPNEHIMQLARLVFVAGVGARVAPWVGKQLKWADVRDIFSS